MNRLVKCKDCGGDISKSARVCPHCGARIIHLGQVILLVFLLCIVVLLYSYLHYANIISFTLPFIRSSGNSAPKISSANVEYDSGRRSKSIGTCHKIILDDGGVVKITENGVTKDYEGIHINLLIENDTEKSMTVQVRDTSINGFMVEPIFSSDIAPGKKINDSIDFYNSYLERAGFNSVGTLTGEIEFRFHLFDFNDIFKNYDTDIVKIEF